MKEHKSNAIIVRQALYSMLACMHMCLPLSLAASQLSPPMRQACRKAHR